MTAIKVEETVTMNKLIKGFFLGAILGTLFAMILGNLAYAGGADQYM